jgi:hypothetical protein
MALLLDIVATLLCGGCATFQIPEDTEKETRLSQVFIAIDPDTVARQVALRVSPTRSWNICNHPRMRLEVGCDTLASAYNPDTDEKISDQDQIVAAAKIGFEGAAGEDVVAIGKTHRLGILLCDFEDILPIGGIDVRGRRRSRIYRDSQR